MEISPRAAFSSLSRAESASGRNFSLYWSFCEDMGSLSGLMGQFAADEVGHGIGRMGKTKDRLPGGRCWFIGRIRRGFPADTAVAQGNQLVIGNGRCNPYPYVRSRRLFLFQVQEALPVVPGVRRQGGAVRLRR